jgi:SAM-dependent methyltransferase
VALHPLAEQFAGVADAYERGRPGYAAAVVGALSAELGLGRGAAVLDLGAGTGKLTRALVAGGLEVTALEPHASLRKLLVTHAPDARVLAAIAEEIPLEEHSVDAVTAADAFHWFDQPRALAEIHRVLRPGGGLAILASAPDWSGVSWAHDVGSLLSARRPAHPHFDGPPWQESVRAAGGWSEPREIRVTSSQQARPEHLADWLTSMSWVAAMPERERAELLSEVATLVRGGDSPALTPVHVSIGLTTRL